MSKFVFLLSGGDYANYSPEEHQKILERFMSWSEKIRKSGHHRASEELKRGGRTLSLKNQQVVDGPFTETKETIGGFFLIEAENLDEAMEIARECPHLTYNGRVEVREVNPH